MAKILVVEDDHSLALVIEDCLRLEHHNVEVAHDGPSALEKLNFFQYDAIVLDWNLPGLSGVELCKEFRATGGQTGILMVTGKETLSDKETGLDAGADDYLTKPFNTKELVVRIRALLRRTGPKLTGNILQTGNIVLDPVHHQVTRDGVAIHLAPKEFALLEFFLRHKSIAFSPEALMARVWTSEEESSPEIIRTHIKNLRKKLETEGCPPVITTVHRVGYKLE